MKRNRRKISLLIVLIVTLLFGCAQRHSHIPRVHKFSHQSNKFVSSGHYVQPRKARAMDASAIIVVPKTLNGPSMGNNIDIKREHALTPFEVEKVIKSDPTPAIHIDSVIKADTVSPYEVDKSLIKGSGTMFAIASGMNVALLITPLYNFFNIGLLLGLALLIIGYFVFKFVENTKQNRINPIKLRSKTFAKRNQVKKAFNILMIISGSGFSLALMTAATGSFGLPIFFSAIGLITLWAGLIVGLVYLIMGA